MNLSNNKGLKNRKYLFLCFFLPAFLLWAIYALMRVWPFGENSVLVLDLNAQYVYYFAEFREKILEGGSLLYSWSRALGGEFMGMFAYYLASPFSAIVALFPLAAITEALLVIMLLKAGLCGLTMGIYLTNTRPSARRETVVFSILYALSSYAVVQCHNTMWIDALIYLPLIALGIEKLITERKYILYTVSLALAIMCNYYIGYMLCIFSFLYFFYAFFSREEGYERDIYLEKHHLIKSLLRMALFSAIALGIAMIIIYPAYYSLTFGKTEFSNPKFAFTQNFDFLDMFAKTLPAAYDTVRPAGLPFLYCGVLTILMLPAYFVTKTVSRREKISSLILLAILTMCMNTQAIDIFWHGMQKPNWLNYRYSFIFCFLIIIFAFKAFDGIDSFKFKTIGTSAAIIGILTIVLQKFDYEYIGDIKTIWFTIGCLIVYSIFLYLAKSRYLRSSAIIMLTLVVSAEVMLSGYLSLAALDDDVVYSSRTGFINFLNRFEPAVAEIKENDDAPFYRIEKEFHRKTNDPMALDINGISSSTSTLNASVVKLMNKFGYASKSHWSKYLGGTPVADSLFGIKYIMYGELPDKLLYEQISADDDSLVYTYLNPYALSLGFASGKSIQNVDIDSYQSPFTFMNDAVSYMAGKDYAPYKELEVVSSDEVNLDSTYTSGHIKYTPINSGKNAYIEFTVSVPANQEIYCYFPSDYNRECDIKLNSRKIGTVFANETDRIISLGYFEEEQEIYVTLELQKENLYLMSSTPYFFTLDGDVFKEAMADLAKNQLDVTVFEDTRVCGNITISPEKPILYTTIPYDEGWILTVDGQKVTTQKTFNSLLSAELTPGEHEITLVYRPACVTVGGIVSVASVFVFALYVTADKLAKKRKREAAKAVIYC